MAAPVLLRSDTSLGHDTGAHPERAARIVAIGRELDRRGGLGWESRESPPAERPLLEAVHPAEHVDRIASICSGETTAIDPDTIAGPGSWEAAVHGAGGAAHMVDLLLGGEAPVAASVHRPPGHHAEAARAMGFCLFNNVAVAARRALDAHGAGRVLVLDWDVHHGNGTNDIFHASDEVLFASVHEWPLYPGTGPAHDVGTGPGEGHTVNLPVPGGSGDEAFCSLVEHVVVPLGRLYAPGLVLLSAGFDAHADDPLATCRVTEAGFAAMAASMRRLGDELEVPVGLVLEGGYALDALARSLCATLEALADPPGPASLELHPLAEQARRRLGERWPGLA
jgi:acetoin utilization deacetylase AcuC-like enzyme